MGVSGVDVSGVGAWGVASGVSAAGAAVFFHGVPVAETAGVGGAVWGRRTWGVGVSGVGVSGSGAWGVASWVSAAGAAASFHGVPLSKNAGIGGAGWGRRSWDVGSPAHGLAYPVGSPASGCAARTARTARSARVMDGMAAPEGGVSAAGGTAPPAPGPVSRTAGRGGDGGGGGGEVRRETGAGLSPPEEIPAHGDTSKTSSATAGCRRAGDGGLLRRTAFLEDAGLRGRTTLRSDLAGAFAGEGAGLRGRADLAAFLVLATAFFAATFFAAEGLFLAVFLAVALVFVFPGCFTMFATRSVSVINTITPPAGYGRIVKNS